MTIAISLKVNDGIILAADSASTIISGVHNRYVHNIYNNANKIFNLHKGSPIGVITWGAGSIGVASISTLIKDFRESLRENIQELNILNIAQKLKKFIYDEHYLPTFKELEDSKKPRLGLIVAGFSSNEMMAEEYTIEINNGQCSEPVLIRDKSASGITWRGELDPIHRLFFGFGISMPDVLKKDLELPAEEIKKMVELFRIKLMAPLIVPAMPIQDAIDLAEFLVDLTIKFSRFMPGAATVGGPIEIAAITKHEGFKWIQRKHFFNNELNQEILK